jgi:hypothetical protein
MKHATGIHQGPEDRMAVVNMLARELEMSVDQVERIYGEEASKIEANARIRTFIPVLVTSRVRAKFRRLKATS